MIYYYAHTGHKIGLERARRGITILSKLREAGKEVQLLVNDFRAGVAMKEEQGWPEYVTIETIQDIDAIAQNGDSVIIDSDEDDHGRLVKYVSDFKTVMRFAHDPSDSSVHGEMLFVPECHSDSCLEAVVIDEQYFKQCEKEKRVLFFLGDYDHDKTILGNESFFKAFDMELLLGHYFFVKYEDDLAKCFAALHEPEEYVELLTGSDTVVTASAQAALEAKASGAKVIYMDIGRPALYPMSLMEHYGIRIVHGFDVSALSEALAAPMPEASSVLKPYPIEEILAHI